jgi:beta-phosphoglucomutase-like phosphatase (HAD superfamily)
MTDPLKIGMESPNVADGTTGADGTTRHRRLGAVILDWAGTTQDYGSLAPVGAFVEAFARFGTSITKAQARGPMGIYKLDHIRAIAAMPEVAERWRQVHGSICTESDIQAIYRELVPIQQQVLPRFCDLIPGTVEAVKEIRARGYKVGSTTGYPRSIGDIAARRAIEQGYQPDVMVCADEVPAAMPSGQLAQLVREAAEKLRAAGAHYLIASIGELPPVLDEIEIGLALGERP